MISLFLDDLTNISGRPSPLFALSISNAFKSTDELAALRSVDNTASGSNIFLKMKEIVSKIEIYVKNLKSVTKIGSGTCEEENWINCTVKETENEKLTSLHCIIH